MFWKRTTTTTNNTIDAQNPTVMQPVVRVPNAGITNAAAYNGPYEPVAAAAVPVAAAPVYERPYEPIVPVAVTSVTNEGMANVATADRTFQPDVRRSYSLVRATQIVWLIAGVLEALFAIRVILKLIAANSAAGFAEFINNITSPFLAPFANLLNNTTSSNGSVLEITTLVGMLVYALLAWGIVRLIWIVFERRVVR